MDFTAAELETLRKDARYRSALISTHESAARDCTDRAEFCTERGYTDAAKRHTERAAYHRATAAMLRGLVAETASLRFYTLTETETAAYDSGDDVQASELTRDLLWRFGATGTEVYHPQGFVAFVYPFENLEVR
jgi:hypothetical protein